MKQDRLSEKLLPQTSYEDAVTKRFRRQARTRINATDDELNIDIHQLRPDESYRKSFDAWNEQHYLQVRWFMGSTAFK